MPQIQIEDLSDEALRRALHDFADIRGIPHSPMIDQYARVDLEVHVQATLEIVSQDQSVTIAEDGTVSASPLPPVQARPAAASRVSPGIARMRANLGTDGTEELRRKVVTDGDAALEAAAKRPDYLSEVSRQDAGGDAAEAASSASTGPANPAAAAAMGAAVARAIDAKGKAVPDLLKMLSKELDPKAREILQRHLTEAQARDAQATKNIVSAPPPRKDRPGGEKPATPRGKVTFNPTDIIHLKVAAGTNPKRSTAGLRFAKYVHGMTVADYTAAIGGDAGQAGRDLVWDQSKGWVEVVPASESPVGK